MKQSLRVVLIKPRFQETNYFLSHQLKKYFFFNNSYKLWETIGPNTSGMEAEGCGTHWFGFLLGHGETLPW